MLTPNVTPVAVAVLVMELVPAAAFGFAAERIAETVARWPVIVRAALPALCCIPYAALALSQNMFSGAGSSYTPCCR